MGEERGCTALRDGREETRICGVQTGRERAFTKEGVGPGRGDGARGGPGLFGWLRRRRRPPSAPVVQWEVGEVPRRGLWAEGGGAQERPVAWERRQAMRRTT